MRGTPYHILQVRPGGKLCVEPFRQFGDETPEADATGRTVGEQQVTYHCNVRAASHGCHQL